MNERDETAFLIDKARQGDNAALERLLQFYRARLESSIQPALERLQRRGIDSEEVMQETFVKAFESLGSFEWEGEDSFAGWLYGIAKNVMLKALRAQRQGPRLGLALEPASSRPPPSRAARREERLQRLEQALSGLSSEHREVIRLSRIEGLKSEEIARKMNRSPEAVRQLLVRALRALRKSFGETESLHLPPRGLSKGTFGNER